MKVPDISKAEFSALLELAESRFYAWHLKELRPERDRRISELKKQNLTSGARAIYAMRIDRELLEREVRERIGFYAAVAHESGNPEMLSKRRLEEYRNRIMTSVGHATSALRDHIERDARSAGDIPESALPNEHRYIQVRAEILHVVNTELRVLEAEGEVAGRAQGEAIVSIKTPEVALSERTTLNTEKHDSGLAGWVTVDISFLSDERVQMNGATSETFNYAELGFADRRNGKPNQAWWTLRALAQERGIIRDSAKTGREWTRVEKRIQEIRKALCKHFGISSDPVPFVEGTGYRTCFKIGCSPSFET